MKQIFAKILAALARKILHKYKPKVIGITGSVGKTSTKEAVFAALQPRFTVWASRKNYNNEFGLPLAVLGADSPGRSIFGWFALLARGLRMIYGHISYPQVLVLEMGVDHPGDMDYLMSIVKPDIAVLTSIGISHLEFFSTQERILEEKSKIFGGLGRHGVAVLNFDDPRIRGAAHKIKGKLATYGFEQGADLRVSSSTVSFDRGSKSFGTNFNLAYKNENAAVFLAGTVGRPHLAACAAAAVVALNLGLSLKDIAANLRNYAAASGRLRLIPGIRHSTIIDDTYNSAPASASTALGELQEFPAARKIAVLGDMLELGRLSDSAHLEIGKEILKYGFDYVFGVGPRMRPVIELLQHGGFSKDRSLHFDSALDAIEPLKVFIDESSAILVKGSQGMRMEKIVKAVMAEPEKAGKLLARQDPKWLKT